MSLDVYLEGNDRDCECCGGTGKSRTELFSANVTHNLNEMAEAAGIYKYLWRPEEVGITTAADLVVPLTAGLNLLKSDPKRFKTFNPSNGWGSYDGFVPWLERYIEACSTYPDASVRANR
jgi:hypothetical protein